MSNNCLDQPRHLVVYDLNQVTHIENLEYMVKLVNGNLVFTVDHSTDPFHVQQLLHLVKCNSRIKQNIKLCLRINQMPENSLEVKFTEPNRPLLGFIEINYQL